MENRAICHAAYLHHCVHLLDAVHHVLYDLLGCEHLERIVFWFGSALLILAGVHFHAKVIVAAGHVTRVHIVIVEGILVRFHFCYSPFVWDCWLGASTGRYEAFWQQLQQLRLVCTLFNIFVLLWFVVGNEYRSCADRRVLALCMPVSYVYGSRVEKRKRINESAFSEENQNK